MKNKIKFFNTIRRIEGEASYSNKILNLINGNSNLGFSGILLFQNNTNDLEPWVFAQELLYKTSDQIPFIALNPNLNHPFYTAGKVLSLSKLYKRQVFINYIIGTSISDMESIGDFLSHDERYQRLKEYIEIVTHLLISPMPLNYNGQYYKVKNLKLPCTIDKKFLPIKFIAGSSEIAKKIRNETNSFALKLAKPISKLEGLNHPSGMYFGIIARSTNTLAYNVMKEKFKPLYPESQQLLELSMKNTDAIWKTNLLKEESDKIFRLEPFKYFNADCPYLVGSHEEVANYINNYIRFGINTFIIDSDVEELKEIGKVISLIKKDSELV